MALRFPYTFYVAAALIVFLGSIAAWTMHTDVKAGDRVILNPAVELSDGDRVEIRT